jgi:hypothetical protein
MFSDPNILSVFSGSLVGFILALVGGGGSILAVPLLIYVVGITSTHQALGTSAIAVSLTALINLIPHWRLGFVKWRCVSFFALFGVVGAFFGSSIAKMVGGEKLLFLFGILMLVVGALMFFKKSTDGDSEVLLTKDTAKTLLSRLIPTGFAVGLLSGFFGIGGGFLIVPALIFATGMPLRYAMGTSLVAVAAFGATTATNYAISGMVDWQIAGFFIFGGAIGGLVGVGASKILGKSTNGLNYIFSAVVVGVGAWIVYQGILRFI